MQPKSNISLGSYLRERRTRLNAAALGYTGPRRRTAGLRREEVAERAGLSVNWYSWLEQGRGGAPSPAALERLSEALMLTEPERRHLFLLGLGHPPDDRYQPLSTVTPRLQRVLDSLAPSPAIVRTATWDVVAWNKAAFVLDDYDALRADERNIMRLLFLNPGTRRVNADWPALGRFIVGIFRADTARSDVRPMVQPLLDELLAQSPEFVSMWHSSDVHSTCGGVRRLLHPVAGELELEFSSFNVDGRSDLVMLVYTPTSDDTANRISRSSNPI